MIWDASETVADLLWIVAVHDTARVSPVFGALEEIGFAILIGECSIDVSYLDYNSSVRM